MDISSVISAGKDMIYLASCALHGKTPDRDEVVSMDFEGIYKMSKFHSMQSIVYISISKCVEKYGEEIIDTELFAKWKASYQSMMRKLIMLDVEREGICKTVSDHGGWYLCLKGVVLQNYYPILGMRQMTDNDILVDDQSCEAVRDYLSSREYQTLSYGKGCHDVYCKGPVTFEIHRKLFSESVKTKRGSDYYRNVKSMLKKGDKPGEMFFGDEDFYVYFLYHAYKHYATAGCGVRTLMDIYVYLSKNTGLDKKYIDRQTDVLGIKGFADYSRELALAVFSPDSGREFLLSEDLSEFLEDYLTSGTFGTSKKYFEKGVMNFSNDGEINKKAKVKYLLRRLFPGMDYYRRAYPKAARWIIPIPFIWFARILRSFGKAKTLANELDTVNKMK